jgi:hypothetical protein
MGNRLVGRIIKPYVLGVLLTSILYLFNRFFLKHQLSNLFLSHYLNDVLAMPFVLSFSALLQYWILQKQIFVPRLNGLMVLLSTSVLFEWILPQFSSTYTSDLYDVLMYCIGWIIFETFINRKHVELQR